MNLLTRKRFLGFLAALPALSLFGADKSALSADKSEFWVPKNTSGKPKFWQWGPLQSQSYVSVLQEVTIGGNITLTLTRQDGGVDVFRLRKRVSVSETSVDMFAYDVTRVVDPGPDMEVDDFTMDYWVSCMVERPSQPICRVTWREVVYLTASSS